MSNILCLLLSFTSIALAFKYQFSIFDTCTVFLMCILAKTYFARIACFKNHFCCLFLLFYVFCSTLVVSLFELSSTGFAKDVILFDEYKDLAIWGCRLIFIILLGYIVSKRQNESFDYCNGLKNGNTCCNIDKQVKSFIIFVFFLQAISISLGITSNMADASLVLPFHLNGVIDELRTGICQFVIGIYIYHNYVNNIRINRSVIILYVIYAIIEVFLKSSKGALVFSFLPIIIMMCFLGAINKKVALKYIVPLVLVFFISYPIIESARQTGQVTMSSIIESSNKSNRTTEEGSSPYIRAFLTGVYYTKAKDYVDSDQTNFCFSNVPILLVMSGGSGFMTKVIDNMPSDIHHSSGVTGLCDALLWGGYPLCYIIAFLLSLLAVWGDKIRNPLYRLIFFSWFYMRIVGNTISYFMDPLFLSSVGTIVIKIFITKLYLKKYY